MACDCPPSLHEPHRVRHASKSSGKAGNLLTIVDPRFLERGFVCLNLWGVRLLILSQFSS